MNGQKNVSQNQINLVCPVCHADLEDVTGGVRCLGCQARFPVVGSVLCFSQNDRLISDSNVRHQRDFYDGRYSAQQSALAQSRAPLPVHVLTFKMGQIDQLISEFRLRADDLVLEVGCGNGWFLRWLNWRYRVRGAGVDISPAAVNLAAASDWGENQYYAAEASQLPFDGGLFDLVVSLDVIEHLSHEHKRRALKEMVRVLRPGGRVLLYAFHIDDKYTDFWFKRAWARLWGGENAVRERERKAYEQEGGHLRSNFITVDGMQTLAQESGLHDVRILPFHAFWTTVYDQYFVPLIVIPLLKLVVRTTRFVGGLDPRGIQPEAPMTAPVTPHWKQTFVRICQPFLKIARGLFSALDRVFIARGHFATMFVIGGKRRCK